MSNCYILLWKQVKFMTFRLCVANSRILLLYYHEQILEKDD